MIIRPNDKLIRYTGRWNVDQNKAQSTANGNYFEFAFAGENAVIAFDTEHCERPFPHIYILVDNETKIDVPLDSYIRINCKDGHHHVKVVMKSSVETQNRWVHPLVSATTLVGINAEDFLPLPQDNRKTIEFIGDSITEGISIDVNMDHYYKNESAMVHWDDSTASYAWRTAQALNLRPYIMGYGCLGILREGAGGVPTVAQSYGYFSDGCPMDSVNADYIVINIGTNDRKYDKEDFKKGYTEFLNVVRTRNKNSTIIALTPFSGCLAAEIKYCTEVHNNKYQDNILYLDTTGLISPEPLHPDRNGHRIISEHLIAFIKEKTHEN